MSGTMSLDHTLCQQMASCVEQLTTSGEKTLDVATMAQIKKICKRSDAYVKHAFHLVMSQLQWEHAEVRLGAFLIIQQLFTRSHCFRELLLARFHSFMQLTMDTEPSMPMPPPKQVANSLKKMAFDSVQEWHIKYSAAYKKLALAYAYLKTCKKVAFDDVEGRSLAERQREEAREERQQRQREEKMSKVMTEISEMGPEIQGCLVQLDNCLQLLLPSPDNFDIAHIPDAPGKHPGHTGHSDAGGDKDDTNVENNATDIEKYSAGGKKDNTNVENDNADLEKHGADVEKRDPDVEKCDTDVEKHDTDVEKRDPDVEKHDTGVEKHDIDVEKHDTDMEKHDTGVEKHDTDVEKRDIGVEKQDTDVEKHGTSELSDHGQTGDGDFVRRHGLGSLNYSIQVCVNDFQLSETEDNVDLLDTLQDTMRLVTGKFLPLTRHWLLAMAKCGGSQDQISRVLQMKQTLERAKHKVAQLKIKRRCGYSTRGRGKQEEGDESEDEDFEEVPQKEGYEATVLHYPREQPQLSGRLGRKGGGGEEWVLSQLCGEEGDPTTGQVSVPSSRLSSTEPSRKLLTDAATNKPSTSSGVCGKKDVPVVPYGTDLLDWGEDFEVPIIARFDMGHRFWAPPREEIVDKNALESKRTRLINFTGTFEPVKWTCRAPLSNGQLCPRMDRFKCPFHGKIIARDNRGKPRNEEDVKREEEEAKEKQGSAPEWEDPELQREIQAATGVDLKRKGKGKGRGKQSNLTDLRESGTSSRKRLEAKIFKRSAVKKVAEAMNSIDAKRFKDKFGNNFNYTHSHT